MRSFDWLSLLWSFVWSALAIWNLHDGTPLTACFFSFIAGGHFLHAFYGGGD